MVFYSHTNSLRRDYDMKIYLCNESVRELQKQKDYRSLFAAEDKVSYMVNRKMKQFFLKTLSIWKLAVMELWFIQFMDPTGQTAL